MGVDDEEAVGLGRGEYWDPAAPGIGVVVYGGYAVVRCGGAGGGRGENRLKGGTAPATLVGH